MINFGSCRIYNHDSWNKFGRADSAVGAYCSDALYLLYISVKRPEDTGHRLLRWTDLFVASGSWNVEGTLSPWLSHISHIVLILLSQHLHCRWLQDVYLLAIQLQSCALVELASLWSKTSLWAAAKVEKCALGIWLMANAGKMSSSITFTHRCCRTCLREERTSDYSARGMHRENIVESVFQSQCGYSMKISFSKVLPRGTGDGSIQSGSSLYSKFPSESRLDQCSARTATGQTERSVLRAHKLVTLIHTYASYLLFLHWSFWSLMVFILFGSRVTYLHYWILSDYGESFVEPKIQFNTTRW